MSQAGYRSGKYKLLWGDHSKDGWYRRARKLKDKIPWEELQIKLVADQNIFRLEDTDWDLEDDKMSPVENPRDDFEFLSQNQTVRLYDLEADPREVRDLSDQEPQLVQTILDKLRLAAKTMRKGNFEPKSVLGHPFFHGGNFAPGWCKPEL